MILAQRLRHERITSPRPKTSRKHVLLPALVLAILGVAALSLPSVAFACAVSPNAAHCYGVSLWSTAGTYSGGLANVRATRLTVPSSATFATAEIWISTNSRDCGSIGESWVEEGIQRPTGGGALKWFWGEKSPSGMYMHHDTTFTPTLGTTYEAKISYNNGNKYAVYRNGTFVGNTATQHSLYTNCFETGVESTHNSNRITGTNNGYQKRGATGTWSANWGGAGPLITPPVTATSSNWGSNVSYSQN